MLIGSSSQILEQFSSLSIDEASEKSPRILALLLRGLPPRSASLERSSLPLKMPNVSLPLRGYESTK
jgi:hypothetical protein